MRRRLRTTIGVAGLTVLTTTASMTMTMTGTSAMVSATAAKPLPSVSGPGAVLGGGCLNPDIPLSVEERRLTATLPRNDDPAVLQSTSFARQMIDGAGFRDFGPAFAGSLCAARSTAQLQKLVEREGARLWDAAVDRAQGQHVTGDLPASDDRPLYWVRLQATAALRQMLPQETVSDSDRSALITLFDTSSRGMRDIDFPAGKGMKRLLMSGFDPYTLDGGPAGTAVGAAGNNIRHGNPSGASVLALDGTRHQTPDGTVVDMEAYNLPVNYTEFAAGYLEDTVGPWMRPGPRQVDASLTMSQAGGSQFNLEEFNGRYHGVSPGNDLSQPCPRIGGVPQIALAQPGCNTSVVDRWGGPTEFDLLDPPQWTVASLPIAEMIRANTGAGVPRPPGDTWPDQSVAFGVVWNTAFTQFSDCASPALTRLNGTVDTQYPPAVPPRAPDPQSCSFSGGGGNYLSNESAYRNTLLRDRMGLDIPAGHIHTPDMQNFNEGNLYDPSDPTFDAWREAIVAQGLNLVEAVADSTDD